MTELTRPLLASRESCTGCGACANGCPKGAITMKQDAEGFFFPVLGDGCVQCMHCTYVCPAAKQREVRSAPAVFAAWSENEALRAASSSGGVFTHLGEYVLELGGVVFGAAMDENLRISHIAVKNTAELSRLRGAKLIQSNIGETYQQVQLYLAQGRYVLFSGTPCQVDGLYRFLGDHPEKLLTCDVLCHGVCSPGVWDKLVSSMAYIKQKKPNRVVFGGKLPGTAERRFRVDFSGGGVYDAPLWKSELGRGIARGLFLRSVCHSCPYATTNRVGDISLGIFKGLPKDFMPEEQKRGISLLLINSVKGAHVFDTLPLRRSKRSLEEAVAGNAALRTPASAGSERHRFFTELSQKPFERVSRIFLSPASSPLPLQGIKEKLWKKKR